MSYKSSHATEQLEDFAGAFGASSISFEIPQGVFITKCYQPECTDQRSAVLLYSRVCMMQKSGKMLGLSPATEVTAQVAHEGRLVYNQALGIDDGVTVTCWECAGKMVYDEVNHYVKTKSNVDAAKGATRVDFYSHFPDLSKQWHTKSFASKWVPNSTATQGTLKYLLTCTDQRLGRMTRKLFKMAIKDAGDIGGTK